MACWPQIVRARSSTCHIRGRLSSEQCHIQSSTQGSVTSSGGKCSQCGQCHIQAGTQGSVTSDGGKCSQSGECHIRAGTQGSVTSRGGKCSQHGRGECHIQCRCSRVECHIQASGRGRVTSEECHIRHQFGPSGSG